MKTKLGILFLFFITHSVFADCMDAVLSAQETNVASDSSAEVVFQEGVYTVERTGDDYHVWVEFDKGARMEVKAIPPVFLAAGNNVFSLVGEGDKILKVENSKFRFFIDQNYKMLPYHAVKGDIREFDSYGIADDTTSYIRDYISWIHAGAFKAGFEVLNDTKIMESIVALGEQKILLNFFEVNGITYRVVFSANQKRYVSIENSGSLGPEEYTSVSIYPVRGEKTSLKADPVFTFEYAVDPEGMFLK